MSSFDRVCTPKFQGEGRATFEVTADWLQGKAMFGGVVTAMGYAVLASLVPAERLPRTVNTVFLSRVEGGTVGVEGVVLRAGRQITLCEARIVQAGILCAVVSVVFGANRASHMIVKPAQRPERPGPEAAQALPFIPGVMPEFTKNFAYRFTDGSFPFCGGSEAVLGGWCRHETEATRGVVGMLGLIDAWPPAVLPIAQRVVPASSITWTVHFVETPELMPEGWCWFRAETVHSDEGFASTLGHFYLPDGRLGAWSEQLVGVFDS